MNTDDVDPKVLEAMVCPRSKTLLKYDQKKNELISKQSGRAYPIRHGIPVMVTAKAREL